MESKVEKSKTPTVGFKLNKSITNVTLQLHEHNQTNKTDYLVTLSCHCDNKSLAEHVIVSLKHILGDIMLEPFIKEYNIK